MPEVAAALADAFVDDPVFAFLRPGRLRQKARLRTMFVVELEQYVLANGGTVWTTSGYDGAVAELPPGAWEMPKSATGKETLRWMWAFGTRLPRAIRVQRAMAERHPREPHFYVRTVGVRPALQGQGVGSLLMQPTLARTDSAALPAYIEASSERSAALYERLGFQHMGVFELPEGGPAGLADASACTRNGCLTPRRQTPVRPAAGRNGRQPGQVLAQPSTVVAFA